METQVRRVAWLSVLECSLAIIATPARAQFEEEDTIPRFAVGVTGEIVFRGSRGQTENGDDVSLGGGPAAGLRLEYRLTRHFGHERADLVAPLGWIDGVHNLSVKLQRDTLA